MNDTAAPLVSVVIPTFNQASYLGRALQSVLDQTYTNWEAIVIDNHSTDNTDELMTSFADPRIIYLKIHNNGVIAASRNAGIRAAKGEWLAFLDSDDLWYQEKLKIVINCVQDDFTIDVCSTDELQVDETTGKRTPLNYGPYCSSFYEVLLLNGNRLSPSATLIKSDFLTKHNLLFRENKEFVTVEDYDFWMLIARAGAKFKFIQSIQGEYTIHANNASGQSDCHQQNAIMVLKDHVYHLQTFQPDKDKLWRYINAGLLISSAKNMLVNSHYISGAKFIISAFRSSLTGTLSYILSKLTRN